MSVDPKEQKSKSVKILNEVLTGELTAINQYFVHAEMCQNWGYARLYKIIRMHSIGEMKHAELVMERILYLDGVPNVQRLGKINIGETVAEQFKLDAALERDAIVKLKANIDELWEIRDHGTRQIVETILADEEEHLDWLEEQIDLISQIGEKNYLAQQVRPDGNA